MENELKEAIKRNDWGKIVSFRRKYIDDEIQKGLSPNEAEMLFVGLYSKLSPKPKRK